MLSARATDDSGEKRLTNRQLGSKRRLSDRPADRKQFNYWPAAAAEVAT